MGLLDRLRGRPDAQPLPPPTYSNDSVIGRIVEEEGVDRTTARAWFDEMLTFLDLYRGSAGVDPMIWAIPAGGTPEGTGGSTEPSGGKDGSGGDSGGGDSGGSSCGGSSCGGSSCGGGGS